MIDLHVHSTRSDGTYTPQELVDYAMVKGLSAFALTDHDTTLGIAEAISYANELKAQGKENVPEVIPGIEISSMRGNKDIHVVGLFIDPDSKILSEYMKRFVESRENRNIKMCNKLSEGGFEITYEELKNAFPDTIITRAHFAALLLKKEYVKSKLEAFERLIGDRCPYYVERESISPEEAVDVILAAGGIPILAHPILYRMSDENLENLARDMKSHGLIGIEAFYSTYKPNEERDIIKLAHKLNLRLSGGSDFHGTNKENIDLGTGMGKLYVDDSILTKLKDSQKNILFTDMDGTLLLNDSTISDNMRNALKKLAENGHRLVLTSGRPLPSILERIKTLRIEDIPGIYVISNNGGLIYDVDSHEILKNVKLPQSLLKKIIPMAVEAGIHVHAYTDTEIIAFRDDDEMKYYRERIHMPLIITDDVAGYLKDGTFKIQMIDLKNKAPLEALKKRIMKECEGEMEVYFTNDQYLEVLPPGITKGDAVLFLTDHLTMCRNHTFAAGDAENDLSMIKAAHTGIAMKNANDTVKAVADIVTKETNDNDGLIEIINKYFL